MKEKLQYGQNPTSNDLDDILDEALAQYAAAEPRAGLEDRILANLRTEQAKPAPRAWWQWGLVATAAVALVIVVALAGKWNKPSTPRVVQRAPTAVQSEPPKKEVAIQGAPEKPRQKLRPRAGRGSAEQSVAAVPKLDQFPSPQPLSEQERLLAMYIDQDPEHAALIAEARMETLRQDAAEKQRMASEDAEKVGR